MALVFTQRFVSKPINSPMAHTSLVRSTASSIVVATIDRFLAGAALPEKLMPENGAVSSMEILDTAACESASYPIVFVIPHRRTVAASEADAK